MWRAPAATAFESRFRKITRSGPGGSGNVVARSAPISMSAPRSSELVEGLRDGGERPLRRLVQRGLQQSVYQAERVFDRTRRTVGDERGQERGLQLVRDKRREVLERLVPSGEPDSHARQALLGRAAPQDRRQSRQRRLEPRVDTATVDN